MNRHIAARTIAAVTLLGLAAPARSALNVSVETLSVGVSVPASCRVSSQQGSAATREVVDLVTLQCANGATPAQPQMFVSEPAESVVDSDDTIHHVVTIHF